MSRFTTSLSTVAENAASDDLMNSSPTTIMDEQPRDDKEAVPRTMTEALTRFFFGPDHGPIAAAMTLSSMVAWRFQLGLASLSPADFLVMGSMIVFWWFQEFFLHSHLLHSKFDWMGKEIHLSHHEKEYFHVSIDPLGLMMGWLLTAHAILRCCMPSLELALSASIGYIMSGLVYEWAHYIAHTRVKPPNAFWRRVRDHHMRHHLVNNDYWFGFTIPGAIDGMFGTNPSVQQARASKRRL